MKTALTDPKNASFRVVGKPLTASAAQKTKHVAEDLAHWDPKLHPRDKGGKFTFKGHGVASTPGKPIKLNTKTIYSTKYQHGQVVAVKHQSGVTSEIRWNAKEKAPGSGAPGRFEVWSDFGHPEQGMAQHKILGKGQAYDALKGDVGWKEPLHPTLVDASKATAPIPDVQTPVVPEQSVDSAILAHFASLDVQNYNVAEVNGFYDKLTSQKYKALSLADRKLALEIAQNMYDYQGETGPREKLESLYGQTIYEMQDEVHSQLEDMLLPQNAEEAMAEIDQMDGPQFLSFIEDHFDELQNMWPDASQKEKDFLLKKATEILENPVAHGFSPYSNDYFKLTDLLTQVDSSNVGVSTINADLAAQIDHLSKKDFQTWMYDHVYPGMWDNITQGERDHIASWANVWGLSNVLDELTSGGSGNLDEHGLTDTQIQDFSNVVDAIIAGHMGGGKAGFSKWIDSSATPALWDTLTPAQRFDLNTAAMKHGLYDQLQAKVNPTGTGNVEKNLQHMAQAVGGTITHDEAPHVGGIENLSKTDFADWLDENVNAHSVGLLSNADAAKIYSVAAKHDLTEKLFILSQTEVTAPQVPSAPTPKVTPNLYDTSGVKSVGSIGTPKVHPATFTGWKYLTQDSAKKMQADMLKQSGKKWTPQETAAVASYTTSVGYQTTNAVLRNDTKRMKMFSQAQLQEAVKRAERLQAAMTPLTENVTLHRGTGAQAFGFPGVNVSFDQLKQFEGKTITEDGFLSTSVVEPTAHGVGFDYATKKPIKMIIHAPEGTPALYVSSATPGYSHENELILGAGTSLRIDSVEPASAADKAKYGSQVEHIVVATVVPSGQPTHVVPQISQPKAPAAPNVTSAVVNGGVGTGKFIKLNTKTVHSTTYTHGQIVAVRQEGNVVSQLYWDANTKNFGLRTGEPGGAWSYHTSIPKKTVYEAYKNDLDWKVPHPGSTIDNSDKTGPGAIGTPSTSTVKAPKITKVDIESMYGEAPQLPDAAFKQLIANIKYVSPLGEVKLSSQSPTIFKAVAYAVAQHNRNNPDAPKLNLLQALKLLDAKSTSPGQENKGLYEAKVVAWLQTAAGKKNAPAFVQWAEDLAHQPAPQKMQAVTKTVKDAYEIGTPDPNAAKFGNITVASGTTMNAQQRAKYGTWTAEQVAALQSYTGGGYSSINSSLRNGNPNEKAALIQSAMAPATRSFTVYRGTDGLGTAMKGHHTLEDLKQLEGKTVTDPAFLSTSVGSSAAFTGKKFHLEIEVPEGTPVAYAYTVSSYKAEREMLLAAGLKYRVISVEPAEGYTAYGKKYTVRLRVVS